MRESNFVFLHQFLDCRIRLMFVFHEKELIFLFLKYYKINLLKMQLKQVKEYLDEDNEIATLQKAIRERKDKRKSYQK